MDRIALNAQERTVLGKKVKNLRRDGLVPAHVFGGKTDVEHVSIKLADFLPVMNQVGETGLIDLKIGEEKIRPVLIRELQHDSAKGKLLHVGFYQVNLKEKVTVPVPLVMIGEENELVKMGEAVVLQNLAEVQVEALPTDLVENIEVDISPLKQIDDAVTVAQLDYDRSKLTILADGEEVVVKLAPAITDEMKKLMEEQEAEAAAAAEAQAETEGEAKEGQEIKEGEGQEGEVKEGEEGQEGGQEGQAEVIGESKEEEAA